MAHDQPISIGAWFRRGWEAFKRNPGALIGGFLLLIVIGLIQLIPILGTIAYLLIAPALSVGFYSMCLKSVRGEEVKVTGIFDGFSYFVPALGAGILLGLAVLGGMILLIVPGVIWGLMFSMWVFAIPDRHLGAVESLKFSARITKGHKGKLFGAVLLAVLLLVIAIIPVGLGLIIVVPWEGATFAAAYESLLSAAGQSRIVVGESPPEPPSTA